VGASPTRQPLQPEAIGAVTEVTKWLKPSISVSRIGDSASVAEPSRACLWFYRSSSGGRAPEKKRGCPSVYRRWASLLVQGHTRFSTVGCRTFSVPSELPSI
jgi:hypothetical protein